ncbi:MAG: cell filamentation protein Fic, partial [Draconibacterium sp.]|nr:cell filamentation protein Fic [Draconibacterium sp.]
YMKDWIERLDVILKMNGRELLAHAGKISHQMASDKSNNEYKKFKVEQKKLEQEQSLNEIESDIKKLKGKKEE